MQSTDNDVYLLAQQMVEAKGHSTGEAREEMVQEVAAMIEQSINLELLSRMTKEQMDGFNELLSNNDASDADITKYISDSCHIDINNVTTVALTKTRFSYLGA